MLGKPTRAFLFGESVSGGFGRPKAMHVPDRHNGIELVVVASGKPRFVFADRIVEISVGDLLLFWGAIPHQLPVVDSDTYVFWFVVPVSYCVCQQNHSQLGGRLLKGEIFRYRQDQLGVLTEGRFELWARDLQEGGGCRPTLMEIEAFFARLAMAFLPSEEIRKVGYYASVPPAERLARHAVENISRAFSIEEAARECGLHPSYAARIFHRCWGITFKSFILRHRILHAQRLLTTTEAKVIDVAHESGFASLSRFYAVFSRLTGISPRVYRKRQQRLKVISHTSAANYGEDQKDQRAGVNCI